MNSVILTGTAAGTDIERDKRKMRRKFRQKRTFAKADYACFTLIELLMMKSCKKNVSSRQRQFAPCLVFPFFIQLLNCSNVRLFNCFSTSYFPVLCSRFLLRRVKIRIFTLIELLIVVAVIAILAAMLLPALNSAREKARGISCLNNHNTIGKAVQMYVSDNQDYFFPYSHWTGGVSGSGSQIIWWNRKSGFINEYLQVKEPDTNVGYILGRDSESYGYDRRSRFACPSQEARVDQTFTINYFYGLDSVLVTKITRYRHPSRTLRTSDYQDTQTVGGYNYAEKVPGSFRHKGFANVSFADGHTGTLARTYVLARSNAYHILFHPTGIFPDTGQFNDW